MSTLRSTMRRLSLALFVSVFALGFLAAVPALADSPWWQISSETVPTNLPPGGEGQLEVRIERPRRHPDRRKQGTGDHHQQAPAGTDRDQDHGSELLALHPPVLLRRSPQPVQPNRGHDHREGARAARHAHDAIRPGERRRRGREQSGLRALAIPISGQPAGFGVADYELQPFNADGTPATQAGAHPFQLTTTLALNQNAEPRTPVALPKDLSFQLPPGLVGNPNAAAQCTMADFFALVEETNLCSSSSAVGVATVTAREPKFSPVFTKTVPVFNLVPSQGEPARFGFEVLGKIPIVIDTSVRSGRDYGVNVTVKDATETAGLLSSQVSFWGVPGDPRHNNARGWECVAGGEYQRQSKKPCPTTSTEPEQPFLTLPSACETNPQAEPVVFSMQADSWVQPGQFLGAEYAWMTEGGQLLGFEGCDQLPFAPEIDVKPEQHSAATPTGLSVVVKVPQQETLEAGKLAEADVRDTTVTLPQGVELNPSAANGLEGCTETQIGYQGLNAASQTEEFNTDKPACPDGSKVGSVSIKTPLLSHELQGSVYLASPAPNGETGLNPFNSLVALYLVAEDPVSGVLVKLAGEGHLDEGTLRISTTFRNAPQVPFEELKLNLFGEARASVSTPSLCGTYTTNAIFTPWSGTPAVSVLSPAADFTVSTGVGGSPCPSSVPFSPGFTAYSQNTQAGAFTGFNLELSRPDGDQALSAVTMHLPPGIAALLSSVELCSEAQAAADACPPGSEVGHATAIAGLGPEPYVQEGGRVFITGPYGGAPFGLEIVTSG